MGNFGRLHMRLISLRGNCREDLESGMQFILSSIAVEKDSLIFVSGFWVRYYP
jgi:hypothetical protein